MVDGLAVATDNGEPKLDRGNGFPVDCAEGETRSITDPEDADLSNLTISSLGSPRLALSVARPSANCSRITAQTSARILSPSCVEIVVSPMVGWDP